MKVRFTVRETATSTSPVSEEPGMRMSSAVQRMMTDLGGSGSLATGAL